VLDLGCGPGEITCELARRRPDIQFTGVDHSRVGLERARANATQLSLTNIRFVEGGLETFTPESPVDLVAMFDAFHHVLDPAAFVERLRPNVARFFLIEPAGSWTGQWDRRHDLDWLPLTLWQIADRLEHEFGPPSPTSVSSPEPATPSAPVTASHAEPTEHRYTIEDLERFFRGYAIDVRGTVAGLQQYGARPYAQGELRARAGEAIYEFVAATERALRDQDLDLAAKHWAIYAERDGRFTTRRVPAVAPTVGIDRGLMPAYGVRVLSCDARSTARVGDNMQLALRLVNTGWLPWSSAPPQPVMVSYHWLDAHDQMLVFEGRRTALAATANQHDEIAVTLDVDAPAAAGTYVLAIDLVHEGVTWFSEQGVPSHRVTIRID
jgi:SAM-dependent methyltransferase